MLNVDVIREKVLSVYKHYDIERLLLFGSYARNEGCEDIDVDLRVDRGFNRVCFWRLLWRYTKSVGVPTYLLTKEQLQDSFLQAIRNDEVLFYEKK